MAQCCCGKYRELDEPLLVNEYIHEPVGPSKFCGPLANHIIRDLEAELAECRLYAEQLRGALGYPVSGDILDNPSIKNGIAEALDQRLAECRRTLEAKDADWKYITDEFFQRGFDSAKKKAVKVFWKERNDALANGCDSLAAAELGAMAIENMEIEVMPKE